MKNVFLCPVCGQPLKIEQKSYLCANAHTFDISQKGYVNLLLSRSHGGHGDNKLMLTARRKFLQKGFYQVLADALCAQLSTLVPAGGVVCDIGCGEGYYTERFSQSLQTINADIFGTDISKDALAAANGAKTHIPYAVASNAKLPYPSGFADVVTALFTPVSEQETARILKNGGYLLLVMPAKNHLMGLKQALYDQPYPNEDDGLTRDWFELCGVQTLSREITLYGEDIQNLFQMTPYYYKTSAADQNKLLALPSLTTEISFLIKKYRVKDKAL